MGLGAIFLTFAVLFGLVALALWADIRAVEHAAKIEAERCRLL